MLKESGGDKCISKDEALYNASKNGNELAVEALIKAGADVHHRQEDWTPLMTASQKDLEEEEWEDDICAGRGWRNRKGKRPSYPVLQMVEVLIEAGADLEERFLEQADEGVLTQLSRLPCLALAVEQVYINSGRGRLPALKFCTAAAMLIHAGADPYAEFEDNEAKGKAKGKAKSALKLAEELIDQKIRTYSSTWLS